MDSYSPEMSIDEIKEAIPPEYEFIQTISSGGFGQVVECQKKDTREVVAVKLPFFEQDTEEEICLLRRLMDHGSDQKHIVKFFGEFNTPLGKGMIFELLDMSLLDYWDIYRPLPPSDISTIIKQVAIALEVLKDMSIIHADLKHENVMVCNGSQRPLHVKLIDFGVARPTAEVEPGMKIQHVSYRPPEVILGLPFNEAADVWALAAMMAEFMLPGHSLFPDCTEYETLKATVKLFGTPSRSYLDKGTDTQWYFRRDGENWIFMTPQEFEDINGYLPDISHTEDFHSLRDLMEFCSIGSSLEENRDIEAATLLFGRMLEIDPEKRITPSEILQHPFICEELESSSVPQAWTKWNNSEKCERFDSLLNRKEIRAILPEGFKVTKVMRSGKFGQLFKCKRLDTGKNVTIKLPFSNNRTRREVQLLERIAENETGQKNIVKLLETFQTIHGEALVLEKQNMGLASYIVQRRPLPMSDIRAIVQQTATALQTLESMGIIHTGVALENIWLCHRRNKPVKIKLADFGAFIERKRALPGMTAQRVHYRAPEIVLGLPFDQAVDVWSLGCILVTMFTEIHLFPNRTEFETLRTMIKMFGQPPDDVLNEATKTHEFFKSVGDSWTLMTAREFEESSLLPEVKIETHPIDDFESLDKVIESHIPAGHNYENVELAACLNLIKAMLHMDGTQRISPAQILEHDFIRLNRETRDPVPEEQVNSVQTPMKSPVILMVQPASPENTTAFVDDYEKSQSVVSPAAARTVDIEPVQAERPKTTVITGGPTSPEAAQVLEQEELQSDSTQSKIEATPDIEEKTEMSKPRVLNVESQNIVSLENGNQQSESPKKQKKHRWRRKVAPMSTEQPTAGSSGSPKKKNVFQRILSWFRCANCFSCNTVD